ncbi:membrane hypothetical protein [Candidatus Magnetomoraceae bacterium gMMP-15]
MFFIISFVGSIGLTITFLFFEPGIHFPVSGFNLSEYGMWVKFLYNYYINGWWIIIIPLFFIFVIPIGYFTKNYLSNIFCYIIFSITIFLAIYIFVCLPAKDTPWEKGGKFYNNGSWRIFQEFVLEPLSLEESDKLKLLKKARIILLAWPYGKDSLHKEYYIFGANILKHFNINLPEVQYYKTDDTINEKFIVKIEDVELKKMIAQLLFDDKKFINFFLKKQLGKKNLNISIRNSKIYVNNISYEGYGVLLGILKDSEKIKLIYDRQVTQLGFSVKIDYTIYNLLFAIVSEKRVFNKNDGPLKIRQKISSIERSDWITMVLKNTD